MFNIEPNTFLTPEIYLQYVTERNRVAAERVIINLKTGNEPINEILQFR